MASSPWVDRPYVDRVDEPAPVDPLQVDLEGRVADLRPAPRLQAELEPEGVPERILEDPGVELRSPGRVRVDGRVATGPLLPCRVVPQAPGRDRPAGEWVAARDDAAHEAVEDGVDGTLVPRRQRHLVLGRDARDPAAREALHGPVPVRHELAHERDDAAGQNHHAEVGQAAATTRRREELRHREERTTGVEPTTPVSRKLIS